MAILQQNNETETALIGKLAFAARAAPLGRLFVKNYIIAYASTTMHMRTSLGGWNFYLHGMVQHNLLTNNPLMQQT